MNLLYHSTTFSQHTDEGPSSSQGWPMAYGVSTLSLWRFHFAVLSVAGCAEEGVGWGRVLASLFTATSNHRTTRLGPKCGLFRASQKQQAGQVPAGASGRSSKFIEPYAYPKVFYAASNWRTSNNGRTSLKELQLIPMHHSKDHNLSRERC